MSAWVNVCTTDDVLENGGSCVKVGEEQVAIFNFDRGQWYAVQNMCPHKKQFVLSRGLIGEDKGEPKVACPLHKNTFSLKTGNHLGGHCAYDLKVYPVRVDGRDIQLNLESCSQQQERSSR